jgi:hypothetical protein
MISWPFVPEKEPTAASEMLVGGERVRLRRCILAEVILYQAAGNYSCTTVDLIGRDPLLEDGKAGRRKSGGESAKQQVSIGL